MKIANEPMKRCSALFYQKKFHLKHQFCLISVAVTPGLHRSVGDMQCSHVPLTGVQLTQPLETKFSTIF